MIDQPKRTLWPTAVAAIVLLPVLFVLSSGPAYWAWINGLLPDAVFELVYAPIFAWSDRLGIWRYMSWYYDLCEG